MVELIVMWAAGGILSLLYLGIAARMIGSAWFSAKLDYHRQVMRESFNPERSK